MSSCPSPLSIELSAYASSAPASSNTAFVRCRCPGQRAGSWLRLAKGPFRPSQAALVSVIDALKPLCTLPVISIFLSASAIVALPGAKRCSVRST